MKNKKIIRIVSMALCLTMAAGSVYFKGVWQETPVYAWASSELESQKNENDSKIAEMQEKLDEIGSDQSEAEDYQNTLTEKIELQEQNITIVDEQLTRIEKEIDETQEDITKTEGTIEDMQAEIDVDLELFKKRIRAMYVSGNESLASALVGATDFFDFLSKYDLISRIAKHDNDLVNGLEDQITAQNEEKAHLEKKKEEQSAQLEEHKATKQELKDSMLELQADFEESKEYSQILEEKAALLNSDIEGLEAANLELEAEDERILAAILEAERKRQEEEAAAKQTTTAKPSYNYTTTTTVKHQSSGGGNSNNNNNNNTTPAQTTKKPAQTTKQPVQTQPPQTEPPVVTTEATTQAPVSSSRLGWPCPGFYTLTSGFGPRWGTHHSGIDISSGGITGASVVAAAGGTVIQVSSGCPHDYPKSSSCGCGGGYGNYVIVQHSNGLATLYAHMSSVAVSYGQSVSQGQTLGYVGSTGFSTGAHLHFEVRVNGTRVDPEQYLY